MSGSIEPPTSSRIGLRQVRSASESARASSIVLVTQDYKKHEIVFPLFGGNDGSLRGSPQVGFSAFVRRINRRICALTGGSPGRRC